MSDGYLVLPSIQFHDLDLDLVFRINESVIDPCNSREFTVVAVILSAATTVFNEYLSCIKYLLLFK